MLGEWQTIGSAPKDGTPILLCWDWEPMIIVGFFGFENSIAGWRVKWSHDLIQGYDDPTHWQPLPALPPQERGSV